MSKIFAGSASTFFLLAVLATSTLFSNVVYQHISSDVALKAKQIATDETVGLSEQELSNLLIATLIGEVANATSDEKSIEHKLKAEVVLSSYHLAKNHQYFEAPALYSE